MIDSNFIEYSKLETLNVSRETFPELEEFRSLILSKNKEINLISRNTEGISRERHINDKLCTDIGSGSGLPGIVLAIIMKHKKSDMEFHLYEKSYHKSNFLREVSKKFNLNTKIFQKNIYEEKNLRTDVIVARAFKPLPVVLDLVNKNFTSFKNIILYMGKNGKQILMETLSNWKFEYKEKKSLTSKDSILIKINKLKKIYE